MRPTIFNMPIPEPSRFRQSNLTKEQRQDQMAALYGVKMDLSHAELERMRQIVKDHDAQRQPMKTIDLNNPPREAYSFQKFPKMVYGGGETLIVRSEDELVDAIADGWDESAPAVSPAPVEIIATKYQAEAERIDGELKAKRSPGRPKANAA